MSSVLVNIGELATPLGSAAVGGKKQGDITLLHNAWVSFDEGVITGVGVGTPPDADRVIDAKGLLVTPGLVDAHTHLVFGGWRENELELKMAGATYLEILAAGGGILSTVRATRAATEDGLYEKSLALLSEMSCGGVTAFELKSGYGLDLDTELMQLRVAKRLAKLNPDIASTYLGAHAVPPEFAGKRAEYIDYICNTVLPEVARQGLAEYCDVFCETGVFNAAESERVLARALELGLRPKIHSDEIDEIGGTLLAGRLCAISAEHLAVTGEEGMDALKSGACVACLLPATSFYLGKGYAPARRMVEKGIPVAIASDFNPGSTPGLSLAFAMRLGCYRMKLTPAEVLTSATLNAAAAIGRADTLGSIEVGKKADLVMWDSPNLKRLFYRYGSNMAQCVIKAGEIFCEKELTYYG